MSTVSALNNFNNLNRNGNKKGDKKVVSKKATTNRGILSNISNTLPPPLNEATEKNKKIPIKNDHIDLEEFAEEVKDVIVDIDANDSTTPWLFSEYINDIHIYLRELEREYNVKKDPLSDQKEVTGRMRSILIDWLVQVHLRFYLQQETLFLTISILDRYLQLRQVLKSELQLVGATALWIASKYEEMYSPEINDFVYISDDAYSINDLKRMEVEVLDTLQFKINPPLPIHFLRRFSKAWDVTGPTHNFAKYIMELTLIDYDFAHIPASKLAAASLFLSGEILEDQKPWNATITHYSKYSKDDLSPLVSKLAQLVLKTNSATKLISVRNKYSHAKFLHISKSDHVNCSLMSQMAEMKI